MTGFALGEINQSTENGEMSITSAETSYNHSFETVEDYLTENDTGVTEYRVDGKIVKFEGVVETPTPPPCNILEERVEETSEGYEFHIDVVQQEDENQVCPTAIAYQEYSASFEAEDPYTIEIFHNGEIGETIEVSEEKEHEDSSVMKEILNWFRNLF